MPIPFEGQDARFLSVDDLDSQAIDEVLDHAHALKSGRSPTTASAPLAGRSVALLFEKPSLRSRVSFEVGVARLGGTPIVVQGSEVGLGTRESAADVGRTLERYVDAIVARVFRHELIVEMAGAVNVPVINALSDLEHPCQAMADALTLREHLGPLGGRQLVYVGDGNNVANSLLLMGALMGMNVRVATPSGYEPDAGILARASAIAAGQGSAVEVVRDPRAAVVDADAVYTDVWTSMGQEAEADPRRRIFPPYAVTRSLMAAAPDGALVMHCLPAHRGEEIESAVLDGPMSVAFDQAENRLWVQMALLLRLMRPKRASVEYPEPLQLPLAIAGGFRTTGRSARG